MFVDFRLFVCLLDCDVCWVWWVCLVDVGFMYWLFWDCFALGFWWLVWSLGFVLGVWLFGWNLCDVRGWYNIVWLLRFGFWLRLFIVLFCSVVCYFGLLDLMLFFLFCVCWCWLFGYLFFDDLGLMFWWIYVCIILIICEVCWFCGLWLGFWVCCLVFVWFLFVCKFDWFRIDLGFELG